MILVHFKLNSTSTLRKSRMLWNVVGGRHKSTHNVHYWNWQFSFSKPPNPDSLCVHVRVLSCVILGQLFATLWTVAHQASLSLGMLQARILEWVAVPSSRGSSQPRDRTQVSHTVGGFFTSWAALFTLWHCHSSHQVIGSMSPPLNLDGSLWVPQHTKFGQSDTMLSLRVQSFKNWQCPCPVSWNAHF